MECSIEGCADPPRSRGWCARHYEAWRRHGDPLGGAGLKKTRKGEAIAFVRKVVAEPWPEHCVTWPFDRYNAEGYGRIYYEGRRWAAHTLVCTLAHGPAPEGTEACHSCHHQLLCVNPRHLRWCTHLENMREHHDYRRERKLASWQERLILAARRRKIVRLADGRTGVLVYAPGTKTAKKKLKPEVRHGDRTKCGVRFGEESGSVFSVEPTDIIEIVDEDVH